MGDLPELDPNAFKRVSAPLPIRGDYRWSRTASGVTSFGLRGRIALTLGTLAVPVLVAKFMGVFGLAMIFLWMIVAWPLLLRDIWKRERILRPDPEEPPRPSGL